MSSLSQLPWLLAAAAPAADVPWYRETVAMIAIAAAVLIVPFLVGIWLNRFLRMPDDYGWKIGVLLVSLSAGAVICVMGWPPKLGIELRGGTYLIYEIDEGAQLERGKDAAIRAIGDNFKNSAGKSPAVEGEVAGHKDELEIRVARSDAKLATKIKEDLGDVEVQGGNLKLEYLDESTEGDDIVIRARLRLIGESAIDMDKLIGALNRRVNPSGLKEVLIRPAGARTVEIIVPESNEQEIAQLKDTISSIGVMEFRFLANRQAPEDLEIIDRAEQPEMQEKTSVRIGTKEVARWVPYVPATGNQEKEGEVNVAPSKDRNTGRLVFDPVTREGKEGKGDTKEALVIIDDQNVTGQYLIRAGQGVDKNGRPTVEFTFNPEGGRLFGELTSKNVPNDERQQQLGVILDKHLLSTATLQSQINDRGQITGVDRERIPGIINILNAGSLPTALGKEPVSEERMSSTSGQDLIDQGMRSMVISVVVVMVFMLIYYRFAGFVASLALGMNLILVLGVMIAVKAAFSLAGLAGLVLTIGMAVDANVLIFERMREEMDRGSTLRLAIRNGFGRATRTIVDANLTTLITAVILYWIGRDQIKGFAIVLILGIIMSMYTAIFCSRIIFDVAEKNRWLKRMSMMRVLSNPNFEFMRKRNLAVACSLVLIVVGLVAVVGRGENILDIDFTGGVAVQVEFKEKVDIAQVRETVQDGKDDVEGLPDVTVAEVGDTRRIFKIDTSLRDEGAQRQVQERLMQLFPGQLVTYDVKSTTPVEVFAGQLPPAATPDLQPGSGREPILPTGGGKTTPPVETPEKTPLPTKTTPTDRFPDPPAKTDQPPEPPAKDKGQDADKSPPPAEPKKTDGETPGGAETGNTQPKAEPPASKTAENPAPAGEGSQNELPKSQSGDSPAKAPEGNVQRRTPGVNVFASGAIAAPSADHPRSTVVFASTDAQPVLFALQDDQVPPTAKTPAAKTSAEKTTSQPAPAQPKAPPAESSAPDEPTAPDAKNGDATAPSKTESAPATDEPPTTTPPTDATPATTPPAGAPPSTTSPGPDNGAAADQAPAKGELEYSQSELTFPENQEINHPTLTKQVSDALKQLGQQDVRFEIFNAERPADGTSVQNFRNWTLRVYGFTAGQLDDLLNSIHKSLVSTPRFPSSSSIGSKVASSTQELAVVAMLLSLVAIIGYIWVRFEKVMYGLAAVVALVHDVLIALGALAISYWLAGPLGFLQVEPFKISLAVLAAFLTIIGYSLNDTIIVFDRIREVRGKSPRLTGPMVNTSINQTLSRTLITSGTTLMVVAILFFFGGQGIHAFAFTLLVGVLVGTYSSIFIASPILLWMTKSDESPGPGARREEKMHAGR